MIEGADLIHIRTPDGDDGEARLVGADPDSDLVLLQADTLTSLQAAPLGDSDRPQLGDWVIAVGSPFGLHHTVTAGIISAKARGMDDSGLEFLQTDGAIDPTRDGDVVLGIAGASSYETAFVPVSVLARQEKTRAREDKGRPQLIR